MLRLKKVYLGELRGFHIASAQNKGAERGRRAGASKLPFAPLENLCNQGVESSMMAHRRLTFDPHGNENTLLVGNKLPRSSGGNIKEKIYRWEEKEPSGSLGQCTGVKKTDSLAQGNCKTTDEQHSESGWRVSHKEKENLRKENGDSRPCSPLETGKQQRGTLKSSKPNENHRGEDSSRAVHKEKQDQEKENVEKLRDSRPCSPSAAVQLQVGTLRKSNDKMKIVKQTSQETRAAFTLFKKFEAMGANCGKTPTELGNYFSPPNKDKHTEAKKKESEVMNQTGAVKPPGARGGIQKQENVYTEPGAPPINPVPKPQRTFQHPASASTGKSQRQGRRQRNLPPLPSISTKTCSKPPSGLHGRPRGERVRDNINRYMENKYEYSAHTPFIKTITNVILHPDRRSFEFEDLFSHSPSKEHHYEDILGQSSSPVSH